MGREMFFPGFLCPPPPKNDRLGSGGAPLSSAALDRHARYRARGTAISGSRAVTVPPPPATPVGRPPSRIPRAEEIPLGRIRFRLPGLFAEGEGG
jgi:hypothetical protein